MNALLLLLLDSRSPAGGHNHSGGMEPAIMSGLVRDLDDVEAFCRGRLRTAGRVSAAFAAAACSLWLSRANGDDWTRLEAELDARTPSEAARGASHQLGRGLVRLVRATAPDFVAPWGADVPNHPLVLGAGVALAGGDPVLAARAAALTTVTVPASAGVRLLGLDPFATHAMSARLAPAIDELAIESAVPLPMSMLPGHSAPALDLLADFHLTAEVRLFAS